MYLFVGEAYFAMCVIVPFFLNSINLCIDPVGLDCRNRWWHLCRRVRNPPNEYPRYDTKPSDGEVSVQKLWGIWSSSSLPLFPGLLGSGVEVNFCVKIWIEWNCLIIYYTRNYKTVASRTIIIWSQYLIPFNSVQTNE